MKNKIDWYFLKRPLIFLFIAIVLSVALILLGQQYEDASYEDYKKGEANLRTTHQLYKSMVNDIDLLEQYTRKYSDYKASGLVGGERRLSWIESLESTNAVLKLPSLSYNLLSQEGFLRDGLTAGRSVSINSSPMELSMSLLHEEDLFALIEGLGLSIRNLFSVDGCSINLMGKAGGSLDTQRANLNSSCVIRWISIDVK
jgi:hypothetical protein